MVIVKERKREGAPLFFAPPDLKNESSVHVMSKAVNPQDTRSTPGICQQPAHEPEEGTRIFDMRWWLWLRG